jgi:hypothetical protein
MKMLAAESPADPVSSQAVALLFETHVHTIEPKDKLRLQYLSKLTTHRVWVPQEERAPKHQTVIIFDWDDTLLFTSFVQQANGRPIPPAMDRLLQRIEQSALQLLESALGLGHTFIITNAMEGWVQESAKRFMPSLLPILEKVSIISARSTQEKKGNTDHTQWKVRAFLEMGRQLDSQIITNLVSIGDSNFELEAAQALGARFAEGFVKTVKLKEMPSPQELAKQHELLVPKLRSIVEKANNLKVKLERSH